VAGRGGRGGMVSAPIYVLGYDSAQVIHLGLTQHLV
jgi:hypothetical protein